MSDDGNTTTIEGFPILNPITPFRYLPPNYDQQFTIVRYIVVSSLAVLTWDILDALRKDVALFSTRRITFLDVVFLLSRIASFTLLLISALLQTAPLKDCRSGVLLSCYLLLVNRACTCTLYFARVYALYPHKRPLQIGLVIFWAFAVGSAANTVRTADSSAGHLLPSMYCLPKFKGKGWELLLSAIGEIIFDIVVCIVVTFKLRNYRIGLDGEKSWKRWFWLHRGWHSGLADRFLQDSQIYFIATASIKVPELLLIVLLSAVKSSGIHVALVYPDIALTNIITSKIYRNMRLGRPGLFQRKPLRAPGSIDISSPIPLSRLSHTTTIQFAQGMGHDTAEESVLEEDPALPKGLT